MKTIIVLGAIAIVASLVAFAPGERMTPDQERDQWQGYLMDAESAEGIVKDSVTALQQAAKFPKATILERGTKSGFGIISEGRWIKFDPEGNKRALEIISKTARTMGVLVEVRGKIVGATLVVSSLVEQTEQFRFQ